MPIQEVNIVGNEDGTLTPLRVAVIPSAAGPALVTSATFSGSVSVDLDLTDEVTIGGPDVGGTRRVAQYREDTGTGQNVLEVIPRPAGAPAHSRVTVTAANAVIVAAAAAGVLGRTIIIRNLGDSTGNEVDLVNAAAAFGTGQPLQTGASAGRYGDPITLRTLGEVRAICDTGLTQDVAITVLDE